MKKIVSFVAACLFASISITAQEKVIPLYNGPAPGSEKWDWNEAELEKNMWQTKIVYNVSKPTLTVFAPAKDKANGTAVIICPGGAFHALSINSEGFDVAKWLVEKGITCFVLKYRLVHSVTNDPLGEMMKRMGSKEGEEETKNAIPLAIADGKAAIALVRSKAAEYSLDTNRIGIIGFSAGGTVAASAGYNYTAADKPDFIAPVYAYFPEELQAAPAKDAPPAFILAASDDMLGLAPHSVSLYSKWIAAHRSAELHLFSKGGHGFGMKVQNLPSDKWINLYYDWLGINGFLKGK